MWGAALGSCRPLHAIHPSFLGSRGIGCPFLGACTLVWCQPLFDAPGHYEASGAQLGPSPVCSWPELDSESGLKPAGAEGWGRPWTPGTRHWTCCSSCLHTPASLSHHDPCLRSPPSSHEGACSLRRRVHPPPPQASGGSSKTGSGCPQEPFLWPGSVLLGGLLLAGSGCGRSGSCFPSRAPGSSPGQARSPGEGELPAGLAQGPRLCWRALSSQSWRPSVCPFVHLPAPVSGALPWCSLVHW